MKNILLIGLLFLIVVSCKNEEQELFKLEEKEGSDKAAIVAIYEANKEAIDEFTQPELDTTKPLEEILYDLGLRDSQDPEPYRWQYKMENGRLTHLEIAGLSLHILPPEISYLTELTFLDLGFNDLETVPSYIGALSKLEILNVDTNNQLRSIAPEIGKLEHLVELWASHSALERLPKEIGALKSLRILSLGSNPNIKCFPQEIWDLQKSDNPLNIRFDNTGISENGDVDCLN